MSVIFHSEEESRYFNMKIGRTKLEKDGIAPIEKEILAGGYDVCKVKIRADDYLSIAKMEELNFPCFFSGGVINYSVPFDEFKKKKNLKIDNPSVSFERYDGSQKKEVKNIILNSWDRDPIGYYKVPFLNRLITRKKETQYLAKYYSDVYTTPDRVIYFLKLDGKYAGLVTYSIDNNTLDTLLVAILPEYRRFGLLNYFIKERYRFSTEQGIALTVCGARLDNMITQHSFEKDGMHKTGIDFTYHIVPFLSFSSAPLYQTEVKKKFTSHQELSAFIFQSILAKAGKKNENYQPFFSRYKITGKQSGDSYRKTIMQFPVCDEKVILCVAKVFGKDQNMEAIGYWGFKK